MSKENFANYWQITQIIFTFSAIVSSLAQISDVLHPSKDYVMSKFVCDVSSSSDRTIYRHWIISDYCPQPLSFFRPQKQIFLDFLSLNKTWNIKVCLWSLKLIRQDNNLLTLDYIWLLSTICGWSKQSCL